LLAVSFLLQGCITHLWTRDWDASTRDYHDYQRVPLEMRFFLSTTNAYATATSIEDGSLIFAGVLVESYDPATLDAHLKTYGLHPYIFNGTMSFYVMTPPSSPSWYNWRSEKVPAAFSEQTPQPVRVTATIDTKSTRTVIGQNAGILLGLPFTLAADVVTSPFQLFMLWILSMDSRAKMY
jgi:hypothetical protein